MGDEPVVIENSAIGKGETLMENYSFIYLFYKQRYDQVYIV